MDLVEETPQAAHDWARLRLILLLAAGVWTLLLTGMLTWSLNTVDREMLGLARQEAIANFNKDQAFRIWGTSHGGVYVPVDERTQPIPFLAHVPERDITTPSGRKLTLLNPAFMLRQMMDDYAALYGVRGRITSIDPLNPNNAPDAWEREALLAFRSGVQEKMEVTDIDGEPYLRLIRPMVTLPGCLKCHGHQGYQVGDVRGGVGVSVPLGHYLVVAEERKLTLWSILGTLWAIGIGGIHLSGRRGRQRIQERVEYEQRIWHQANFDGLTHLANRNLFLDRLEQALAYAERDGHHLALLFIDLDRFKNVNDTRGHATGDTLLTEAAQRIRQCVRHVDSVARLGGDEFTVILPEIVSQVSASKVAGKILTELSRPFRLDEVDVHLSASIGITTYPEDGDTPGELLKNADTAMYRAKAAGRSTYRFFTREMDAAAKERVNLETALREAIKQRDLKLHYQPVLDTASGALVGAEALLRWNHAERGQVSPASFIPVAEDSGLIVPIGDWVLREAAAQLARWDETGSRIRHLAVNVSSIQFLAPGFVASLIEVLEQWPDLRDRLILEITESVFLEEHRQVGDTLEILRDLGLHIAIDDFGTGYSSLGYLKRFPVDFLKIDRSFVNDLPADSEDAALCVAIISMAHHLSLKVVAEGVETRAQKEFLSAHDCDLAQGFLFGRPMPPDEFRQLLVEQPPARRASG